MLRLASVLAVLTGCYAPELTDCTVTCGAPDECAGAQVCNSAGLCAAEGVTCAGAAPDAPTAMIALKVHVEGTGKVVVAGVGECNDDRDCTWQVPVAMVRLDALEVDSDSPFEKWTTTNCGSAPQVPTCTFSPNAATTVGAKFR